MPVAGGGSAVIAAPKLEVFEVATKSATGPKTYFYSLIGQ